MNKVECLDCGLVNEGGRFCGRCGGRLPTATTSPGKPASSRHQAPPKPAPNDLEGFDFDAPLSERAEKAMATPPGPGREPIQAVKAVPEDDLDRLAAEVKKKPHSLEAYLNLAQAQVKRGKPERAYSSWRAMKTLSPDDLRIHPIGARILEALGRRDEAIGQLTKLLQRSPDNIDEALQLARLQHESGKRREALETLQSLRRRASEHPELLLRLAQYQLALGEAAGAQEDLSSYRKLAGENREVFQLLGQAMLHQSFHDGAIRLYREALARFSNDPDFLLGLGKALLGIGEKGQALLEFERACQAAPNRIEILLEMGRLYGSMGMEDKAEEMFSRIRGQSVRDGEVFLAIARHYQARRQNRQALAELERARERSPHHSEIVRTLAEVLESERETGRALVEYEAFLEGTPNAVWALQGVIRCALAVNEFPRVAKAQRSAIDHGQGTPDLWCDYGETLIRLGKFKDAEKAFEQAAKLDPTCVRAYQAPELIKLERARAEGEKLMHQAREAVQKKFLLTAADRVERALELVPRETSWMKLLAEISLRTGNLSRAADLLTKVRAGNSDDYWAAFELARVYDWEEKAQLAIELLSLTLREHPLELDGHLLLLRLKRGQIQGDRFERDMMAALARNSQHELAPLLKTSPIPLLVEGYLSYLFGVGSKFQADAIKRAEELFEEALSRFGNEVGPAHRGLCLIYRLRGDNRKAANQLQELVRSSADPAHLYALARLNTSFQLFGEARRCFSSLRSLFPENGLYRRRLIEAMAAEVELGGKNELMDLINSCQETLRSEPQQFQALFDLAWAQTMVARKSAQREEWIRRALLTWNKLAALPDAPVWARWGLLEIQLEFQRGQERHRSLQVNLKACEKITREHPDNPWAHHYLGVAHLGFDDLTQTDRAAEHLETASFLAPENAETILLLARAYRALGKSARVDAMKQVMLLLEPELVLKM